MDLEDRLAALAADMAARMRLRGERLEDLSVAAGRRVPRRLRGEMRHLVEVERMAANPRLARRVDLAALERSERRLRRFLDGLDPGAARRDEILDRLAAVAFVIFVTALAVFLFLLWRGDLT